MPDIKLPKKSNEDGLFKILDKIIKENVEKIEGWLRERGICDANAGTAMICCGIAVLISFYFSVQIMTDNSGEYRGAMAVLSSLLISGGISGFIIFVNSSKKMPLEKVDEWNKEIHSTGIAFFLAALTVSLCSLNASAFIVTGIFFFLLVGSYFASYEYDSIGLKEEEKETSLLVSG